MDTATPAEQEAFLWLQARLVELLLRHDASRFERVFDSRVAAPTADPRLTRYRDLAVVRYLRGELFDSILPRIKSRLSFAAPREFRREEPPTRGRIDWSRTAAANWHERPGEPPLEVITRARRRHFSTPENLLTVVTLLEYRRAVARLLEMEAVLAGASALRHPLHEIVEACTRELIFPQFAGLQMEATAILAGVNPQAVLDLETTVADGLPPGHNSAYDDLLNWRQRLRGLSLLNRTVASASPPMLGADPDEADYLYQIWLFYEWGDLLARTNRLLTWTTSPMTLTFNWGSGDTIQIYGLQHDQGIPGLPAYWQTDVSDLRGPGVRPDFYIWRLDREAHAVYDGATLVWREPGYVLDAKYYRPRTSTQAPSEPLKRMIADLQLTSERNGALIFAFQASRMALVNGREGGPLLEPDLDETATAASALYHLLPHVPTAQRVAPDQSVGIWRVCPSLSGMDPSATLTALLETVHQALAQRIEVRCRGIFLDSLTATAHGDLAGTAGLTDRVGLPVDVPIEDLLLCPKPHVAAWRVDLVRRSRDCCQNAILCHIKGQPLVQPPQRLTQLSDIQAAIRNVDGSQESEAIAQIASQQVLLITQRYADLVQPDIAYYRQWVRDALAIGDLFETTPLLAEAQRETLALARFLWEQIDHIHASNFAGPALLFTGVLEYATQKAIHKKRPQLYTTEGVRLGDTLGTLGNCKDHGGTNWPILDGYVRNKGLWNDQIAPEHTYTFSRWIDTVRDIVPIRNNAAHRASVDRVAFQTLVSCFFGSPLTGVGAFNGLLLAWISPPTGTRTTSQ